jgi:putative transposase
VPFLEYQRGTHHVYLVNYHLVWCPKRRKPVLTGAVRNRLTQIIRDISKERSWNILALEVMPDHVHLFISVAPTVPAHEVANRMKGRSSNLLRKEFPELLKIPSLWTHSYFASTAGNVSMATIKRYIEEQTRQ